MRVLLAFDKFKDALPASRACSIARRELLRTLPGCSVTTAPLADGGDGFTDALLGAIPGEQVPVRTSGPLGAPLQTAFGIVDASRLPTAVLSLLAPARPRRLAILELARASGLALVPPAQRSPWTTSTRGTGQLLRAAAEAGADGAILGLGGSATHDLGLGALDALGFDFLGDPPAPDAPPARFRPPLPAVWHRLTRIEGAPFPRLPTTWLALDVSNPLLGPSGATATFAPQKGLQPHDAQRLEDLSARTARLLLDATRAPDSLLDTPGSGAAGGTAFGLLAALGARPLDGFGLVSAWLDLDRLIASADLVITGEGRFDRSSLGGKGPGALARRAAARGIPVWILAGSVDGVTALEIGPGVTLTALSPPGLDLPAALRETPDRLAAAVFALATSRPDR